MDDGSHVATVKDDTLRGTLMFGQSDKIYKDAIILGNTSTSNQAYNLAKTDESTNLR